MSAVYLAAALECAPAMVDLACLLIDEGHDIVSTWHGRVSKGAVDPRDRASRYTVLASNILDMSAASVVVVDTRAGMPCATFGEVSWALATGRRVVWIQPEGGRRVDGVRCANIWDAHPLVTVVHDWARAVEALDDIDADVRPTLRHTPVAR